MEENEIKFAKQDLELWLAFILTILFCIRFFFVKFVTKEAAIAAIEYHKDDLQLEIARECNSNLPDNKHSNQNSNASRQNCDIQKGRNSHDSVPVRNKEKDFDVKERNFSQKFENKCSMNSSPSCEHVLPQRQPNVNRCQSREFESQCHTPNMNQMQRRDYDSQCHEPNMNRCQIREFESHGHERYQKHEYESCGNVPNVNQYHESGYKSRVKEPNVTQYNKHVYESGDHGPNVTQYERSHYESRDHGPNVSQYNKPVYESHDHAPTVSQYERSGYKPQVHSGWSNPLKITPIIDEEDSTSDSKSVGSNSNLTTALVPKSYAPLVADENKNVVVLDLASAVKNSEGRYICHQYTRYSMFNSIT